MSGNWPCCCRLHCLRLRTKHWHTLTFGIYNWYTSGRPACRHYIVNTSAFVKTNLKNENCLVITYFQSWAPAIYSLIDPLIDNPLTFLVISQIANTLLFQVRRSSNVNPLTHFLAIMCLLIRSANLIF